MKTITIKRLPIGLYVIEGAGPEDSHTCSGVGVLLRVAHVLQDEATSDALSEMNARHENKEKAS